MNGRSEMGGRRRSDVNEVTTEVNADATLQRHDKYEEGFA
jgi:hypothetical protein